MSEHAAVDLVSQMLWTSFLTCFPLLVIGLIAGVLISLFQIITSIQDPSFSAVPRLFAFFATLLLFLPWIITRLINYTVWLFQHITNYVG